MTLPRNRQQVLSYLNYMQDGNIDAALALTHDNVRFWMPGTGELSKQALKSFFDEVGPMIESMTFTIHGIIEQSDRLAVEASGIGHLSNGKTYENEYHFLFEMQDGLIVVMKEYADTAPAAVFFE